MNEIDGLYEEGKAKVASVVDQLMKAKEAYYNDEPIISDEDFDDLEELLHHMDPNNIYFSIVGVNIKGSNKIKHSIPMRSCAKAKTVEDIFAWLKKIGYDGAIAGMPKIDGLSGSIKYVNGNLSYISTRGDGEIGQDVSWLKDYLNIPQTISTEADWTEVRGEIYIPKNTKMETKGKPLRNIAAGLVNRKDDKTGCEHLRFIAYSISPNNQDFFTRDLEELWKIGFDVVPYSLSIETPIEEYALEYIETLRNEWYYETDGLVYQVEDKTKYEEINSKYTVDHHNHYNIALKPESETAVTTLTGITWEVSKNGNVIPVANFLPIYLGDKEIKNATLNNYENVEKLDLHEGDEIVVANSNEIIPLFVKKNKSGTGPLLTIEFCPSCASMLSRKGVHVRCMNSDCPDQIIKTITQYCVRCEMDGVSSSTISKLYYELGIHSIYELYFLKTQREKLLSLDGFGESKVDNLLAQIEKSKKQTELQLIANFGIEGVHTKGLKKLGVDTLKKWEDFTDSSSVNGQKIIEFRDTNMKFIYKMFQIVNPIRETIIKTSDLGTVCVTGKGPAGRKELEERLISMGYEPVDGVGKETNILVCEDVNGDSSKLSKARKLGIMIKSYEEFFK